MAGKRILISREDLPVTCPPETEWNKHPRVCIPFRDGVVQSVCPYCGNLFEIKEAADREGGAQGEKEGS